MTDTINVQGPAKGNWKEMKAKIMAEFPTLAETDLRYENGKKDVMLERIYKKLSKTKAEFDAIIGKL